MKRISKVTLAAAVIVLLTACGSASESVPVPDVTSAENSSSAPVTITMFGTWSDQISDIARNLQAAVNTRYPGITLEYEAFPTGAGPYTDELTRRLAHGKEADLFMTANTALCGSEALLDLTQQEFASRYSVSILQQMSDDGSVWMLPGIGTVQCYAYCTEELDTPPQTLEELVSTTSELSASGVHSFIVPYEQTQSLMIQALAAGYLASPAGQLWLEDYNQGNGFMSENPQMKAVWAAAENMIASGAFCEEDMVFAESRRVTRMSEGLGAMSMVSSAMVNSLTDGEHGSSFSLIPIVGDTPDDKTVFCAPAYYLAASSHLNEAGNEAKKAAVLTVLDFISTEEGQDILRGSSPLANSYLSSVNFPLDTRYSQVADALRSGAYGPVPVFERGGGGCHWRILW